MSGFILLGGGDDNSGVELGIGVIGAPRVPVQVLVHRVDVRAAGSHHFDIVVVFQEFDSSGNSGLPVAEYLLENLITHDYCVVSVHVSNEELENPVSSRGIGNKKIISIVSIVVVVHLYPLPERRFFLLIILYNVLNLLVFNVSHANDGIDATRNS